MCQSRWVRLKLLKVYIFYQELFWYWLKSIICEKASMNKNWKWLIFVVHRRYRLAVIKALPQLQKLDNVQITQDELREAQRKGKNLYHPEEEQDVSEEEEYIPPTPPQQYNRYQEYSEQEYSPPAQRSPPRQEVRFSFIFNLVY